MPRLVHLLCLAAIAPIGITAVRLLPEAWFTTLTPTSSAFLGAAASGVICLALGLVVTARFFR